MHEAAYSLEARDFRSSGEGLSDASTAESTRGDLGGVRVAGKDECRNGGAVVVVGDNGGLQCDVACRNGGGPQS